MTDFLNTTSKFSVLINSVKESVSLNNLTGCMCLFRMKRPLPIAVISTIGDCTIKKTYDGIKLFQHKHLVLFKMFESILPSPSGHRSPVGPESYLLDLCRHFRYVGTSK